MDWNAVTGEQGILAQREGNAETEYSPNTTNTWEGDNENCVYLGFIKIKMNNLKGELQSSKETGENDL